MPLYSHWWAARKRLAVDGVRGCSIGMRRVALALAAAACCAVPADKAAVPGDGGTAKHGKPRTKHGRPYPETKAECGVVMFGTGDDYIQYSARNAQRIAALAPGSGWCAAQPDLDRVPVVYFHDNVNADALVRKGLGGAAPRFELFYLGTRANPTMAKFEALPGTKRWARDYKWLRPQTFARSPFSITLGMDGDAVPCGARLVEAVLCGKRALRTRALRRRRCVTFIMAPAQNGSDDAHPPERPRRRSGRVASSRAPRPTRLLRPLGTSHVGWNCVHRCVSALYSYMSLSRSVPL